MSRRVVITGMGGISALGQDWDSVKARLQAGQNAVVRMDEWDRFDGLHTRLAAPVSDFSTPAHYSRKKIRSMGRVSLMATRASEMALEDAGLLHDPLIASGAMGIAYGSSTGSTDPITAFGDMLKHGDMSGVTATSYIRMMAHTTAVNVGVFFGLKGRVLTTSTRNDTPELTPRPFDRDRDGLVIGEGACTLVLEELEHAKARGARIYAEVLGFGTNSDGLHVTQPNADTMEKAIRLALKDAKIAPQQIGYVNAHGTATDRGDAAESRATVAVFGEQMPISSLKSYTGHTLGACGALEAWWSIMMMRDGWFAPTINLENVAEDCAELDYIRAEGRALDTDLVMSNNFAFGGINTSLIFRRWQD
ncbi:beta-ketoacyl-[acyl-carrier-protein] synthase [bacterium 19CA01SA08]|uniref:Beta-ketoacyl-[acyl-carrier-protein] synthase n=1 Tax=bacterium 19CA01SA08 TaxID=2920574 RepID=A0AAU6VRN2_UNCXX